MQFSTLLLLPFLALGVSALPAPLARRAADPAFSLPDSTYRNAITCPNGIQNKPGGVVLLVHGTASTGEETWANGPYVKILPNDPNGPGYDVCWVDLPMRALGDAQISAEYVAFAIKDLAPQSTTGQVSVIAHSQGAGLNTQWALGYFPSTQPLVSDFVGLAGDFRGTDEGPFACAGLTLLEGGCNPSIIQQTPGSAYLDAQMAIAGSALVPTTSLYTIYDEIIQNQIVPPISSDLPGSKLISIQDVCTTAHITDHFGMTIDSAAYGLALDALTHAGTADPTRFTLAQATAYCSGSYDTGVATDIQQNFANVPLVAKQAALDVVAVLTYPKVKQEPALQPYVCKAGGAPAGTCAAPMPVPSNTLNRRYASRINLKARTGRNAYRDMIDQRF